MLIALILAFGNFSSAETPSAFTLCKLNREVRTLKIESIKGGNCRTTYTKYGKDQNIGEAQNKSSCESFMGRVRETLEKAGWSCRDVKEASSSTLGGEGTP